MKIKELNLYIKKMQIRALFYLIAILSIIISFVFGIALLFIPSYASIIFFSIIIISILYLIYYVNSSKKEVKGKKYDPVILISNKSFSFEDVVCIFENITDKENQLSISSQVRFFRFNNSLKVRAVLYQTNNFNKKEFDNAKARINKIANRKLKISQWVSHDEARKMIRFNIICTNALNEQLYQIVSNNVNYNLSRVEGVINIVILENQIIIPPFYGKCYLLEINRYKNIVKFISNVLINT